MKRGETMLLARGLTLIELMIVVAVLAILAAIVIPTVSSAQQEARVSAQMADFKSFKNAFEMYRSENNEVPTAMSGMLEYLPPDSFSTLSPVGGQRYRYGWDWAQNSTTSNRAIRVVYPTNPVSAEVSDSWRLIDERMDDGNLNRGNGSIYIWNKIGYYELGR